MEWQYCRRRLNLNIQIFHTWIATCKVLTASRIHLEERRKYASSFTTGSQVTPKGLPRFSGVSAIKLSLCQGTGDGLSAVNSHLATVITAHSQVSPHRSSRQCPAGWCPPSARATRKGTKKKEKKKKTHHHHVPKSSQESGKKKRTKSKNNPISPQKQLPSTMLVMGCIIPLNSSSASALLLH